MPSWNLSTAAAPEITVGRCTPDRFFVGLGRFLQAPQIAQAIAGFREWSQRPCARRLHCRHRPAPENGAALPPAAPGRLRPHRPFAAPDRGGNAPWRCRRPPRGRPSRRRRGIWRGAVGRRRAQRAGHRVPAGGRCGLLRSAKRAWLQSPSFCAACSRTRVARARACGRPRFATSASTLLRQIHHALRRPAGLEPVQHRQEVGQLQQRQLAGEPGILELFPVEIPRQFGHRLGPAGAEGVRFVAP